MDVTATLIITASIFLWGVLSARLERADLTAPILFVAIGALLAALGLIETPEGPEGLKVLVEITLVWVLFSDAARVPVQELRHDLGPYVRLLAIGLPLTMLAGWGLAWWFFPAAGAWVALLVAAALAPTDAALGIPVVTNPVVPARVRRLITVESGLNDGIATPVVMLAIAAVAAEEELSGASGLPTALVSLLVGAVVGGLVGLVGGRVLRWTRRQGWAAEDFVGIAVLALALIAYTAALALDANGFVAAFCGGLPSVPQPAAAGRLSWCSWSSPPAWSRSWYGSRSGRSRARSCSISSPRQWCCTPCSASPSSGWSPLPWPAWEPGSTAARFSSSAGSGPAASPPWCSRCSLSRTWALTRTRRSPRSG